MSLKGYYKTDVVTVTPEHSIKDAAQMMRDFRVGDVVVIKNEAGKRIPVGLLTDRDIAVECVAQALSRINESTVEEFMTKEPVCAIEEEGIYEIVQKMRHHGVARMPVIDSKGVLVGIVTAKNILALLNDELSEIVEIADRQREIGQAQQGKAAVASQIEAASQQHMQ